MATGFQAWCKGCHRKYRSQPRVYAKQLAMNAAWSKTAAGIESKRKAAREHDRRHLLENPERKKAHDAVKYAILTGRITARSCEVCGSGKVHGHHDDYRKYYDVRWLCALHHKAEHKRLKSISHDFHG